MENHVETLNFNNLVSKRKLFEALEFLEQKCAKNDIDFYKSITLIKGELTAIIKDYINGVIDSDGKSVRENKIAKRIIELYQYKSIF